jgi:5-methylcytosine-specific restriction protein B
MPPQQRIFFGSPGVGKSHLVQSTILPELGISAGGENCVNTVFHPEYTYGDFIGKLLPISKEGKVEYHFYAGHMLKALARAYRCILDNPQQPQNVALVIDEINRGNAAAIFGSVFQLLDRDSDGWSSYRVDVSRMEFDALISLIGIRTLRETGNKQTSLYKFEQTEFHDIDQLIAPLKITSGQLRIPPNLSIIATMNTSDTSIYYMDSAFKRRWDWEFVSIDSHRSASTEPAFTTREEWARFVRQLNGFIRRNSNSVRSLEDKQIGYWFIKEIPVTQSHIQNKLMFFLWDSVFPRDKRPLAELVATSAGDLSTFGDFTARVQNFISYVRALPEA